MNNKPHHEDARLTTATTSAQSLPQTTHKQPETTAQVESVRTSRFHAPGFQAHGKIHRRDITITVALLIVCVITLEWIANAERTGYQSDQLTELARPIVHAMKTVGATELVCSSGATVNLKIESVDLAIRPERGAAAAVACPFNHRLHIFPDQSVRIMPLRPNEGRPWEVEQDATRLSAAELKPKFDTIAAAILGNKDELKQRAKNVIKYRTLQQREQSSIRTHLEAVH